MSQEKKQTNQQATLVRGMAWLTAGNFISRLLGAIYVIPWYMWLGQHAAEANALFNMGYQVYANFLLISTVGLPTAVAKQIAKYNVLGKQDVSYYLVREIFKLMLMLGAVFAGIMYLASPWLAEVSGDKDLLLPVMHSLVPPLFIFPAMSIMRGFFQGHHDMKPYAVSQIVEQIVRVIWILASTFYIMKLGSGNYHEAVIQSTFAAFVSMVASIAVLVYTLYQQGFIKQIFRKKPATVEMDIKSLILETVKEAIPLIVLGSAFQIFQMIDQVTFANVMKGISSYSNKELLALYSYMLANPSKITMLIIGITGSIGSVAIPIITEQFVQGDKKGTGETISGNLQMLFIIVLPAIMGTVLLARPLYQVFYSQAQPIEIRLFIVNLLLIFVQGLYAVLGVVIQAIFEKRRAILDFLIGLGVKTILQVPFLYLFQVYGPLLASAVGLMVTVYLLYRHIDRVVPLNHQRIQKDFLAILWMTLIMGTIVFLVETGLSLVLPAQGRMTSVLHLIISGSVGVLVFAYLSLRNRQIDPLLGAKADRLRKVFRIV